MQALLYNWECRSVLWFGVGCGSPVFCHRLTALLFLIGKVFSGQYISSAQVVKMRGSKMNTGIKKRDILIVDNDAMVREVLIAILEKPGTCFTETTSFTETIEVLQQRSFDTIIIDNDLPDGQGIELILEACNSSGNVILMSGDLFHDGLKETTLVLGASGFLEKPFRVAELLEMVAPDIRPEFAL
jgi:CheY-like chemotaxis protein